MQTNYYKVIDVLLSDIEELEKARNIAINMKQFDVAAMKLIQIEVLNQLFREILEIK